MARRKNARYTGSALSGHGDGPRELVNSFYGTIGFNITGTRPVPIPPPASVHPKHDLETQAFIFADCAVRKIADIALDRPDLDLEEYGLPDLSQLPQIVDTHTANVVATVVELVVEAVEAYDAAEYHDRYSTDDPLYIKTLYAAAEAVEAARDGHAIKAARATAEAACNVGLLKSKTWEAVTEMLAAL